MAGLSALGYPPQPFTRQNQQEQHQKQKRLMLMRLGLAGFGMMQVSMVAIALYAGGMQGIDPEWLSLLRWLSLLVATPIVLFSAQPFWMAAFTNLRSKNLTMDVPVSLAIVLAYLASAWATVHQTGEVYFDSVSMFTFFLLWGRYMEMRLRYRNQLQSGHASDLLPQIVHRQTQDGVEAIARTQLKVGDKLVVYSGDVIACDGIVRSGNSQVIEAVLTGESEPCYKTVGDQAIAGTQNRGDTLVIEALQVGKNTRLSQITDLVAEVEQQKPAIQVLANRVASYFVAAVLVVSAVVFSVWYQIQPEHALWITLSVLVVTCPCALSLATPTALTAAVACMRQAGLLIVKGHVVENLTRIDKVIFDKTGTLTEGAPSIESVVMIDDSYSREDALSIAAALERFSNHPVALAFKPHQNELLPESTASHPSLGVEGVLNGRVFKLGKPDFALDQVVEPPEHHASSCPQWLILSEAGKPIAWFGLSDSIRASAVTVVSDLQKQGIDVEILSGDGQGVVESVANALGIGRYRFNQSPEQKLAYVQSQQERYKVLMVGDGVNDAPVLAGAAVSMAMNNSSEFTRTSADSLLLKDELNVITKALRLAHQGKKTIRQNLTWSLFYNASALPLAAMGWVPPYLAAIGMSLSSLLVVFNAMRLYRFNKKEA